MANECWKSDWNKFTGRTPDTPQIEHHKGELATRPLFFCKSPTCKWCSFDKTTDGKCQLCHQKLCYIGVRVRNPAAPASR